MQKKFIFLFSIMSVIILFSINNAGSKIKPNPKFSPQLKKQQPRKKILTPFSIQKIGQKKYRVKFIFTLQNPAMTLTKLIVALPFPDTTVPHYQSISNVILPAGWSRQTASNGEIYARLETSGSQLPKKGQTKSYYFQFDATLYGLKATGSLKTNAKITLNSENRNYLRSDAPYLNHSESRISSISLGLWSQAKANALDYAEKAYNYVATKYRYQQAYTGLHPLTDILNSNGGDCGNLSSIFISLMRARNIPARHLVAVSPQQNYHAWAEFYIDGAGWVPVDVTYKNSNRNGNYFGNYDINNAHIVLHKRLNLDLKITGSNTFKAPILQTFAYWVYGSGNTATLRPSFKVQSTNL